MVKGSNKAADRLAKLEEQRARINAEIQRVRAREQQQERKNETRRKVLVGAMILAKVNSSEWPEDRLMAAMDASTTAPCSVCRHARRMSRAE